jgi:hypothetical protein
METCVPHKGDAPEGPRRAVRLGQVEHGEYIHLMTSLPLPSPRPLVGLYDYKLKLKLKLTHDQTERW